MVGWRVISALWLAGLRLGYVISSQDVIRDLRQFQPPWSVNIVAQEAGIVAIREIGYIDQCRKKIMEAKKFLVEELSSTGYRMLPSRTNFFLIKVGDGKTFRSALLRHGILVRDCASFGLPEYIRIATRTLPECRTFISTIKKLKRQGLLSAAT